MTRSKENPTNYFTMETRASSSKSASARLRTAAANIFFGLSVVLIASFVAVYPVSTFAATSATSHHIEVGIQQRLGQYIPMNVVFKDAAGHDVTLKQVADGKPLIIDMAYYECPGICDVVMAGVKKIVDELPQKAGRNFNVATISFNPADRPFNAMKKKKQFWGTLERRVPSSAWRFLTGDSSDIYTLTNALGFYFIRDKYGMFTHPTALIVVDSNGKIIRYILGTSFHYADLDMALNEAKGGTPEQIISTEPKTCFSHTPPGNRFAESALQYGGVGTMVLVAGFLLFVKSKKKFGRDQKTDD